MIGWGVASKVHPRGEDWSDVVTWDAFKKPSRPLPISYRSRWG